MLLPKKVKFIDSQFATNRFIIHKINFFSSFTFISLQTGKAPYYVGATQTLPRGHVYTDRSKGSIGIYVHKDMFISLLCVYAMKSRELFVDCVIEKCD